MTNKPTDALYQGSEVLQQYNNSVAALVQSSYPNHPWQVWRFKVVPRQWWRDINNQRTFLVHVFHTLWQTKGYQISLEDAQELIYCRTQHLLSTNQETREKLLSEVYSLKVSDIIQAGGTN